METIIKSGKLRVLVLATEGNYITVQLKNGKIHSFATEYDFSSFMNFLAGAVIDIIVKGRGKNKDISLADNTINNILSDETLASFIAEEIFVAEILAEHEKAASLSFNRTCCLAEDRLNTVIKEKKIGIENLGKFRASRIFKNKIIARNIDIFFYIMKEEALDNLTEERIQSVCSLISIDSEVLPLAQQQMEERQQKIRELVINLSNANSEFEKLAPKNIIAKIGIATETPIIAVVNSKKRFEIDTERMTPEAYWCLLVNKSFNEPCNFLLYDNGKVVPNTKLENTQMPPETREEMKIIKDNQRKLVSLYAIIAGKKRLIHIIGKEIFALAAAERTSEKNLEYSRKKYEKSRVKKELLSYEREIDNLESMIADLKIHWQKATKE